MSLVIFNFQLQQELLWDENGEIFSCDYMDVVYVNAAQDDAFVSHLNAKK